MKRMILTAANICLLVFLLFAVPEMTSKRLGGLTVSARSPAWLLTQWGLVAALAGNLVAAWVTRRNRRDSRLCLGWTAVFGVLLVVAHLHFYGYVQFDWLKDTLLRMSRSV